MTKSKTTSSFRLDDDFIELLDTWAFVAQVEKGILLQDAFREYTKMKQNSDIAQKVETVRGIMK
ncbi:hypothetical protein D3C74_131860 [compost metagenome]